MLAAGAAKGKTGTREFFCADDSGAYGTACPPGKPVSQAETYSGGQAGTPALAKDRSAD